MSPTEQTEKTEPDFTVVAIEKLLKEFKERGLLDFEFVELARALGGPRPAGDRYGSSDNRRHAHVDAVVKTLREQVLYPDLANERKARELLGNSFCGMSELCRALNRGLTDAELKAMSAKLIEQSELLTAHKETHLLVMTPQLTRSELAKYAAPLLAPDQAEKLEKLGHDGTTYPSWQFIRADPLPRSKGKTLEKQQELVPSDEMVPRLGNLLCTMVTLHHQRNRRLFKGKFVRLTTDSRTYGAHLGIGWPTPAGIEIREFWDDQGYPDLHMTSAVFEPR
jgi:hypothetical protein